MRVESVPAMLNRPVSEGRSEGVHLSGIIRCIATETHILTPDQCEDLSLIDLNQEEWWAGLDEVARLRISIGLAWEQWYIPQIGHVTDHPGELFLDGVYMSPDGESLDVILAPPYSFSMRAYDIFLHEVKATYKSINTVEGKRGQENWLSTQWMWTTQLKGYCKGMGIRVAYLHVLYLCGDYSYPIRPQLRVYRVEFTQEEIDENWELMIDYMNVHLEEQE